MLITGATGYVGRELLRLLRARGSPILPTDVEHRDMPGVVRCDLRNREDVTRLFSSKTIGTVIHLAGVLPTAYQAHPLAGAEVNLGGSLALFAEAVKTRVQRFVLASSISLYGTQRHDMMTEDDAAIPDEVYGASKRVVELVGENLAAQGTIEFVSLRIARVIGAGLRRASSAWRGEIFESRGPVEIPFAPQAELSLVHAEDVARMLITLVDAAAPRHGVYNTPAEKWKAASLKSVVEEIRGIKVELMQGGPRGGPRSDGRRFTEEFGFQITGLRERLSRAPA